MTQPLQQPARRHQRHRARRSLIALTALGLGAAVVAAGTGHAAPTAAPTAGPPKGVRPTGPNPYLSTLPSGAHPDYAAWRRAMAVAGKAHNASPARLAAQRVATARTALPAPLLYDEKEPTALRGSNDRQADAEPVGRFGTGAGDNPRLRLLGNTAKVVVQTSALSGIKEDNGQLNKAINTKINGRGGITASSTIGDGPHGKKKGDGKNDYDFYKLTAAVSL